jgi:DNA-binding beta-propeller fold protein YncE
VRVGVTPDGRTLVYGVMQDRAVEFADTATGRVLGRVPLGGEPVSLTVSADGRRAYASAQYIDTVYVVSIPDRRIEREFKTAPGSGPDPVLPLR